MLISTPQIKSEHIQTVLERDVGSPLTTGFERYRFVHQALPEVNYPQIDVSVNLLGKTLAAPLLISPMTGGAEISAVVNRNLARAAQELGLGMGVGSQKVGLLNPDMAYTYQVRDVAPDILLLGNLGAIHLVRYDYGAEECRRAMDMIKADGLYLYLNPLQEALQPGEKPNFKAVVEQISRVTKAVDFPIVVKEVGFGISPQTAILLRDAGVAAIDVAGAGGTSWGRVERFLALGDAYDPRHDPFDDWGIPTAEALVGAVDAVPDLPVIASGGIRTGVDIAKALALGATAAAIARPLLAPALESAEAVTATLRRVIEELKIAMLCAGASSLADLTPDMLRRI